MCDFAALRDPRLRPDGTDPAHDMTPGRAYYERRVAPRHVPSRFGERPIPWPQLSPDVRARIEGVARG